jgi:uncharacterized protein (DUF1786 family)
MYSRYAVLCVVLAVMCNSVIYSSCVLDFDQQRDLGNRVQRFLKMKKSPLSVAR